MIILPLLGSAHAPIRSWLLQADSQKNSHPVVQQHNGNIASIMQSFDTITYCKGASVLRMLCHCVGPARFLEGTRRFVVDHQYACATQEDLWKAVQVSAGQGTGFFSRVDEKQYSYVFFLLSGNAVGVSIEVHMTERKY